MSRLVLASLLLAVAACHAAPEAGINADQAASLDNAEELMDASPDGLTAAPGDNAGAEAVGNDG